MKYKVWHIERKEWIHDLWDLYIDADGDIWEIEERGSYDRYMSKTWMTNSVEIVRFTGIKDKNRVEIYEGDILQIPDLYETPENTSMTFHNEIITFKNFTFNLGDSPLGEDYEYISDECEVSGNIYENPELLEVKA